MSIQFKNRKVPQVAVALWSRRADALKAGSVLVSEKPDRDAWSRHELRVWRYAMAISRRVEQLH